MNKTTIQFTRDQIVALRKGFDAGAPTKEDFAEAEFAVELADVEACADLLRDAYSPTPPLELELTPHLAHTMEMCFEVGAESDESMPEAVYKEVKDLLLKARR